LAKRFFSPARKGRFAKARVRARLILSVRPPSSSLLVPLLLVAVGAGFGAYWFAGRRAASEPTAPELAPDLGVASARATSAANFDEAAAAELARLRTEVRLLREQLETARGSLDETSATLEQATRELARLRRPLEVDMASATLRANLAPGEGVVTGGYRLPDGTRLFAFVETDALPDGGIGLMSRFFSVPDELGRSLGLDTLSTEAANTLQHGEVWVRDELTEIAGKLEQNPAAKILSAGIASITPGKGGEVPIISQAGAPPLSLNVHAVYDEQRNLDFELRVESVPAAPGEAAPTPMSSPAPSPAPTKP
jgi:hypothetical protein